MNEPFYQWRVFIIYGGRRRSRLKYVGTVTAPDELRAFAMAQAKKIVWQGTPMERCRFKRK